jgi:hypothetical protein
MSAVLGYCVECKGSGGPRQITPEDKRRLSKVPIGQDPRRTTEPYRPRTYVMDDTPRWKTVLRYAGAAIFLVLGVLVLWNAIAMLFLSTIIDFRNFILLTGIFFLLASFNTFFTGISALLGVNKWHIVMASVVLFIITGLMLWAGAGTGQIWWGLLFLILTVVAMFMVLEGWPMKTHITGVRRTVKHGSPRIR